MTTIMFRRFLYLLIPSLFLSACQISLPIQTDLVSTPAATPVQTTEITPTPEPIQLQNLLEVVKGTATVKSVEKKVSTISAPETAKLNDGDVITTSANSLAVVYYHDDSFIRLAPETSLTYFQTENSTTKLKQSQGTIYVRFKKILGIQESFELETPTALATVRGTGFINRILPQNKNRLIVTESNVLLRRLDTKTRKPKEDSEQEVATGDQADLDSADKPARISKQKPDNFEKIWLKYNSDSDQIPRGNLLLKEHPLATISATFLKSQTSDIKSQISNVKSQIVISALPTSDGYVSGLVKTDTNQYSLSCVSAPKSSVRVVTDSADDNDCKNDCKVMPLSEFANRNQALAAMNGMYFCPAEYPACIDKKNSFDTLLFNYRLKKYINSDNNVYSVLPLVVFMENGSIRFLEKTLEWGRDNSITGAIAGNPLLVRGGQAVTSDSQLDEKQRTVRYGAGAIVEKGDFIHMCNIRGANILETSRIYASLGADNAINIDGGGSTAIWYSGSYRLGPGRNIPNAVMFVRK